MTKSITEALKSLIPFYGKKSRWGMIVTLRGLIGIMPKFLIIGGQRCGTTSLYTYLTQHSNVCPAPRKELNFFDISYSKGVSYYKGRFPFAIKKYLASTLFGRELITGEASPYYLYYPHAPTRINKTLPEVKLIVILRNPVDRAFSHYKYNIKVGYENPSLSFENAIQLEEERLAKERERILRNQHYISFEHQMFSYLSRGIYVDQLEHWMNFFPREQFLILISEDFYTNPETTLNQALVFLGLPELKLEKYERHNPTNNVSMDSGTRKYLSDFFRPHNQRLYEFLGMDFWWS